MTKHQYLPLWIALSLTTALLLSARALAAPNRQTQESPLRSPELPIERLGLRSPYSVLGVNVDGAGLAADAAIDEVAAQPRGTITERMTLHAQTVNEASAYNGRTWLTYYGRPGIPVMGILGEYDDIDELAGVLREQAREYEIANGRELDVLPAYHLVYGMATKATGDDGSHLAYLEEGVVLSYITRAAESDFAVILDVQIGALTPSESISPALPYLEYENVHLAIDPEFAMVHPGQYWPGNPIGYVTAEQVNDVQATIQRYLRRNRLAGDRVLLVHQFQSNMILEPEQIDRDVDQVAVTISVDGWGGPWAKISKYNSLVDQDAPYVAFKLFYRWDEPILSPGQALGEEGVPEIGIIDVTPNMIIYQ